MPEKTTFFE